MKLVAEVSEGREIGFLLFFFPRGLFDPLSLREIMDFTQAMSCDG